jgi:hypothetical protein
VEGGVLSLFLGGKNGGVIIHEQDVFNILIFRPLALNGADWVLFLELDEPHASTFASLTGRVIWCVFHLL